LDHFTVVLLAGTEPQQRPVVELIPKEGFARPWEHARGGLHLELLPEDEDTGMEQARRASFVDLLLQCQQLSVQRQSQSSESQRQVCSTLQRYVAVTVPLIGRLCFVE